MPRRAHRDITREPRQSDSPRPTVICSVNGRTVTLSGGWVSGTPPRFPTAPVLQRRTGQQVGPDQPGPGPGTGTDAGEAWPSFGPRGGRNPRRLHIHMVLVTKIDGRRRCELPARCMTRHPKYVSNRKKRNAGNRAARGRPTVSSSSDLPNNGINHSLAHHAKPTQAYEALLTQMSHRWGPVGEALQAAHTRRRRHLTEMTPDHDTLLRALGQLADSLRWFAESPDLHPEIAHLIECAVHDLQQGVESVFSDADPRVLDESRHLMEVELLFRTFAREPGELQAWIDIESHRRNAKFGFGRLLDREARARDVREGYSLPDRREYSAHSEVVHPIPYPDRPAPAEDLAGGMFCDLGDLYQHGIRIYGIMPALLDATLPPNSRPPKRARPATPDFIQARRLIQDFTHMIGGEVTRPQSEPKNTIRAREGTIGATGRGTT